MKTPPIDWPDLYALGVLDGGTVAGSQRGYTVDPQPPRLVRQLLAELATRPAPEEDQRHDMADVRRERNERLAASDWTQVADAPVDQAAWAAYRQALRDLPSVYAGEGPIPWPVAP